MRCNIYKDQLESAELFGKPVLYTGLSIERESVPDNWFCYDLAASDRNRFPLNLQAGEKHRLSEQLRTLKLVLVNVATQWFHSPFLFG